MADSSLMDDTPEGAWVSLGDFDVARSDLVGPGSPWDDVIPAEVDARVGADVRALMPAQGWRQVTPWKPQDRANNSTLFAALIDGGWALVGLVEREGIGPILTGDPGPVRVRASRWERRRGLELRGAQHTLRCRPSELSRLSVRLVNAGGEPWTADPDDHAYVHGWLRDASGARKGSDWFAYSPGSYSLPALLAPGESVELPVDFGPALTDLTPGTYGVEVAMHTFDLHGDIGVVEIW